MGYDIEELHQINVKYH